MSKKVNTEHIGEYHRNPIYDRKPLESLLQKGLATKIIDTCIPSQTIRDYLATQCLSPYDIEQIILKAPVSLYEKTAFLEPLSAEANYADNEIVFYLEKIRGAIEAFEASGNCVFNLVEKWFDDDLLDEKSSSGQPFLSAQKAIEYIKQDIEEGELDETMAAWYEIERWVDAGDGNLEHCITFTLIGTDPVFIYEPVRRNGVSMPANRDRVRLTDGFLNIPLPFRVGDIVTIDCLPFAPPMTALIIEPSTSDCCHPQILLRNEKRIWEITSLKHSDFALSPCYRLEHHQGPLPDEDQVLSKVKDWLQADPKRGSFFWSETLYDHSNMTATDVLRQIDLVDKKWREEMNG